MSVIEIVYFKLIAGAHEENSLCEDRCIQTE
jgi:hypothetical protein